jgi:hypothetical protein
MQLPLRTCGVCLTAAFRTPVGRRGVIGAIPADPHAKSDACNGSAAARSDGVTRRSGQAIPSISGHLAASTLQRAPATAVPGTCYLESEGFAAVGPSQPAVDGGWTAGPSARVQVRGEADVLISLASSWGDSQRAVKVRAEGDGVDSKPRDGAGGFRRRPVADRMSAWSAQTEQFMPSRKGLTSADAQDSGYAQAPTPRGGAAYLRTRR